MEISAVCTNHLGRILDDGHRFACLLRGGTDVEGGQ